MQNVLVYSMSYAVFKCMSRDPDFGNLLLGALLFTYVALIVGVMISAVYSVVSCKSGIFMNPGMAFVVDPAEIKHLKECCIHDN